MNLKRRILKPMIMKRYLQIALSALLIALVAVPFNSYAGNEQRAGSAGAGELLINPWARSAGWGGINTAGARGVEAVFLNVAGTAFTERTELVFSHTDWFGDADINVDAFGFTQRVGETGALSVTIMAMGFGDIEITTTELPDGGLGTYSATYLNLGVSYAKKFTENIYGGVTVKLISHSLPDLNAAGVCFDAGIQYVTGEKDNIKFGIGLKNVGPAMSFQGDGLSLSLPTLFGNFDATVEQRSSNFELPSLLNIGGSYDFLWTDTRLTAAANFTSNSFTRDQIGAGLEFSYKEWVMLRAGYVYENEIFDAATAQTIFSGFNGGLSFEVPLGDSGTTFGVDYAYRHTRDFGGFNTFGAKISL